MVEPEDLRAYVGGSQTDIEFITGCVIEAMLLVNQYVSNTTVPEEILDNAVLVTGSELFNRRNAPSGIAQFASLDGAPIRVSLDPMRQTYALLDRWVVRGV
jgi:hypothetical protein